MTGTLVNVAAVVLGGLIGTVLGGRVSDRLRTTLTDVLGVFVVVLGIGDALGTFGDVLADALGRAAVLVVLGSLLVGAVVGELLRIEDRLERLGAWLRDRATREAGRSPSRARFVEGFVVTSLVITVGPLAVLGAFADGLSGDWTLLAVKSLLDGPVALAFASVFGVGVVFAVLPMFAWQGGLSVAAATVGSTVSEPAVAALSAVGGFLVIGIGLRLLELRQVRVANLLPALLVAPLVVALWP